MFIRKSIDGQVEQESATEKANKNWYPLFLA